MLSVTNCHVAPQEYTNYHFDVAPGHLRGALERFAQFFVAPLCKEGAMEREVRFRSGVARAPFG